MSNVYHPCGHYVLVKMDAIETKTDWGFQMYTPEQEKREQAGQCIATVVSFGPTAYKGFAGCNGPDDWGVKVGDRFETTRYAGLQCHAEGMSDYRLIQDNEIIAILKESVDE